MRPMHRGTLRVAAALTAVALLVALLGAAPGTRSVTFWKRYAGTQLAPHAVAALRYQPRELLSGSNEPPAPRVAPALEALDGAAFESAAAYAAAHRSRALIISRHDHIVYERYWRGASFDTLSDSGGFTPVLAALATGVAVSHRVVAWADQPLRYFVPAWRSDARGTITLRNLMQMSSGLTPPPASLSPWSASAQQRFGTNIIAAVMSEPLGATPGTLRREQPADPQLLAAALEQAAGMRYADYVSRVLWRRLGAADAWLWLDRPGGAARADCCMLARLGDWIRVGQLMVSNGRYRGAELMRPGWVALMRSPARADADYGAFVRVGARIEGGSEPYAAPDLFVLEGGGGSRMWMMPALQLVVLLIGSGESVETSWDDPRIPNAVARAARDFLPAAARPGADLSTLVPGH
jgi:CubicO group peptidase (beta-lactamase class C family)